VITTRLEANWGVILHPLSRATNRKIFSSETPDRAQAVTSTTCGAIPLKNLFWLPVTGRRQNDWQRTNRSRNTNALPRHSECLPLLLNHPGERFRWCFPHQLVHDGLDIDWCLQMPNSLRPDDRAMFAIRLHDNFCNSIARRLSDPSLATLSGLLLPLFSLPVVQLMAGRTLENVLHTALRSAFNLQSHCSKKWPVRESNRQCSQHNSERMTFISAACRSTLPLVLHSPLPRVSIEPHPYLRALLRDFRLAGGRVVLREFHDIDEIATLPEPVVVNCTGLGSGLVLRCGTHPYQGPANIPIAPARSELHRACGRPLHVSSAGRHCAWRHACAGRLESRA
jgi:hypothetical protein